MTHREYKKLGIHWSVMEESQRPVNLRARWFCLFDLRAGWRLRFGITPLYHAWGRFMKDCDLSEKIRNERNKTEEAANNLSEARDGALSAG